jgi:predicted nuclease of predicted toxin-antitoxin system
VLRFHLDEHVDHAIAIGLRKRGIDVTTTTEAGLLGSEDEAHIVFALREQRVIYTNDADYLAFAAESGQHAGIVYVLVQREMEF